MAMLSDRYNADICYPMHLYKPYFLEIFALLAYLHHGNIGYMLHGIDV